MRTFKQLFRHAPEAGVTGDCWRSTIACLLDMHPSEVPHFVEGCWEDGLEVKRRTKAWLATRGLSMVENAFDCDLHDVLSSVGSINPGLHYLLGGNSRNGTGHSVVCCDDQIVWDPALDNSGIVAPMDDGYYWVTWLVPAILRKAA